VRDTLVSYLVAAACYVPWAAAAALLFPRSVAAFAAALAGGFATAVWVDLRRQARRRAR